MCTINIAKLATKLRAYHNCIKINNTEWQDKHESAIIEMLENLPSGSGFDSGINFDWEKSTHLKLIFNFEYHHLMDGYYDGWTKHKLILTPTFGRYAMRITGRDKNQSKEYFYDLFSSLFTITDDEK